MEEPASDRLLKASAVIAMELLNRAGDELTGKKAKVQKYANCPAQDSVGLSDGRVFRVVVIRNKYFCK